MFLFLSAPDHRPELAVQHRPAQLIAEERLAEAALGGRFSVTIKKCGFFSGKIKGLDCVSIGPDQYDLHTPRERLSISSTERVYKFILEVLKEQKPA